MYTYIYAQISLHSLQNESLMRRTAQKCVVCLLCLQFFIFLGIKVIIQANKNLAARVGFKNILSQTYLVSKEAFGYSSRKSLLKTISAACLTAKHWHGKQLHCILDITSNNLRLNNVAKSSRSTLRTNLRLSKRKI